MIPCGNIVLTALAAAKSPEKARRLALRALAAALALTGLSGWQYTYGQSLSGSTSTTVLSGQTLNGSAAGFGSTPGSGTLSVFSKGKELGSCPLQHTDVQAKISGYVARVSVKQLFTNTFKEKIEAVYTFPLPENAAVDAMTMKVGQRTISGTIKKREEARDIYEAARAQGYVASLLDQERTNIFTQSVANIMPGESIEITITYVDLLPYEAGTYSFAFPTVVGPRFIPGTSTGTKSGTGRVADTDKVPDASRITPPVAAIGERAGHDISIDVDIDAGMAIGLVESKVHDVNVQRGDKSDKAHVSLRDKSTIPNKDFVLSWDVAKDKIKSGYLTHKTGASGYFTMMMMPPKRVPPEEVAPKEMIFLIDCSGSQSGAPLDKAKETLDYIVDHMNANDTFQILSFNNNVTQFAPQPLRVNGEMKKRAKEFIHNLQANGGTWMAPAVEQACKIQADEHRLRIVCFMTDGYVGNDFEILGMVRKLRGNSRWFPFGTGSSVNRMLIDGVAKEGGGEAEYVLLNSPGNVVGKKFYDRISTPVLTDVKLDFHGLPVKEVFPHDISDVWAERPLYIKGRYLEGSQGTVTITGYAGGKPYKQDLAVTLPKLEPANDVLGPIWARAKVDRLMSEDYFGAQKGSVNKELKDDIIKTALEHHIMTQYTSFVAVEEKKVNEGGKVKTVPVNVELPEGVAREQVLGDEGESGAPIGFGGNGANGQVMNMVRSPRTRAFRASSGRRYGLAGAGLVPPPPPMVASTSGGGYGRAGASPIPKASYGRAGASYAPAPVAVGGGGGSAAGYAPPPVAPSAASECAALPSPSLPPPPLPGSSSNSATRVAGALFKPSRQAYLAKHAEKKVVDDRPDSFKDKARQEGADKKEQASKLDSILTGILAQVKANAQIAAQKITVTITLSDTSAATLKALKALGIEIKQVKHNAVVAILTGSQIEPVAQLAVVTKMEAQKPLTR